MGEDTHLGGAAGAFPSTHWSIVRSLPDRRDPEWRRRVESLAHLYWKPVYRYVRIRWRATNEEAKDLTQDFFLEMMEGRMLEAAGQVTSRFSTFLRACLENFLRRKRRDGLRKKRGGGRLRLPIDPSEPDRIDPPAGDLSPEEILDREWRAAILEAAIDRMRRGYEAEGRPAYFEVFRRAKLSDESDRPTHAALAADLGLSLTDVGNYLAHARRRLALAIREAVADSVSSEEALVEELAHLLGERRP